MLFSVVDSFFSHLFPPLIINTSAQQQQQQQHYLSSYLRRQETLFQEQSLSAKMNCELLKIEALF